MRKVTLNMKEQNSGFQLQNNGAVSNRLNDFIFQHLVSKAFITRYQLILFFIKNNTFIKSDI